MTGTEMKAFESKINFTLLSDIISTVIKTANAAYQQTEALFQRCIFLLQTEGDKNLQEKYGFMYLGELLERYEDRFGMPIEDRRAIALALGYTRDLTTDVMFVGSQRDNFIRTVKKCAQGDIYLTGALYLLYEGTNDGAAYESC